MRDGGEESLSTEKAGAVEIEDVPIDDILSCMVIKDYYNDKIS